MTDDTTVYIEIETCDLHLSEVIREIQRLVEEHPDQEIMMDGDRYAVVGRRRGKA